MDTSESNYRAIGRAEPYMWLVSAVAALLCFSVGGVINGQLSDFPIHLKLTTSLSSLTFIILLLVIFSVRFMITENRLPSIYDTNLVRNGKLAPGVLYGYFGGIITTLGQLSYILGWFFDDNGRGIIVSIFSASTIFTSVLSYLIFNERLSVCQLIGMFISCGGIVLLSIESSFDGTWVAYICGIGSFLLFGLSNLISRKMQIEGLDPYTGGSLYSFGDFSAGTLLLLILLCGGYEINQPEFNFGQGYIGSLIIIGGVFSLTRALMMGHIAISLSIINSQGALFIFLEYLIFGVEPSLMKLIGAMIVIMGLTILFVGDIVLRKMKRAKLRS